MEMHGEEEREKEWKNNRLEGKIRKESDNERREDITDRKE